MTEADIQDSHRQRTAFVYIRQSSPAQVANNTESTRRQYALAGRAQRLGWPPERIEVIDEDLGVSADTFEQRDGFQRLASEVALGHCGLVLGLEVSRLARNSTDWHRLLEVCAVTDTVIADSDGLYNPCDYNDRLLLGIKGTLSEAELHLLKSRLLEGKRAKAARGELRCPLPIGYVWGRGDGEVLFDPDEEIVASVQLVFGRFAALGSMRRVWVWFREESLDFPVRVRPGQAVRWLPPSYSSIVGILKNPVYAGAYVYGKSRRERYVDANGQLRTRTRVLPRSQWQVFLPNHHVGYVDWETYEANQARIAANGSVTRVGPESGGRPVREGIALLQGLAECGRCGCRLRTWYQKKTAPVYWCRGSSADDRPGAVCMRIGARMVDRAVAETVLEVVREGGAQAALEAVERIGEQREAILAQRRLAVERAEYEALCAERAYRAVDPENRRVARGLERDWELRLANLERERTELALKESSEPDPLSPQRRAALCALGEDLPRAWEAATTTARDRKELLRTVVRKVVLDAPRKERQAQVRVVWQGGLHSELTVDRPHNRPPLICTDEETADLLRRLAVHYPDAIIAGILNSQGRKTARGLRFTRQRVGALRQTRKIPCYRPPAGQPDGAVYNLRQAADELGVSASMLHRMVNNGSLAGEQVTRGAPWRIRLTAAVRGLFVDQAPAGYVAMHVATSRLRVPRATVMDWIQRGRLKAVVLRRGRGSGWRIRIPDSQMNLFDEEQEADRGTSDG